MTADPGFNLISVVYPYVCRRLLTDPSPSLRAALKDLIVAEDGSVQWEVLEALMSDSNFLHQRVAAGGETRWIFMIRISIVAQEGSGCASCKEHVLKILWNRLYEDVL